MADAPTSSDITRHTDHLAEKTQQALDKDNLQVMKDAWIADRILDPNGVITTEQETTLFRILAAANGLIAPD